MITQLIFSAYSDDNITLEISEDGTKVFDDEFGTDHKVFKINDEFSVVFTHGTPHDIRKGGWYVSVGDFDEDKDILNNYQITIAQNSEKKYSPLLCMTYNGEVVIDGVYGGPKTKFHEIAQNYVDHSWLDIDKFYDELKKAGLLK